MAPRPEARSDSCHPLWVIPRYGQGGSIGPTADRGALHRVVLGILQEAK